MAEHISIERFLELSASFPIVDVRAPSEYADGHIPGAVNIPLFSDQERKEVGTAYKQINKEAAMYLGHMYYSGESVERDLARANAYYRRGAEAGDVRTRSTYLRFLLDDDAVDFASPEAVSWLVDVAAGDAGASAAPRKQRMMNLHLGSRRWRRVRPVSNSKSGGMVLSGTVAKRF